MGTVQSREKMLDLTINIKRNIKSIVKYLKRDRRAEYIYKEIHRNEFDFTEDYGN